jgi:U6 snRNA-associated Sm-like protein LSm1
MQVPHNTLPGFLPGATSLVEQLDTTILLILRDNTHLIGTLRSFDQFSNLVLTSVLERRFCYSEGKFCDKIVGTYLVRGDNVVMLGEVDEDKKDDVEGMARVTPVEMDDIMKGVNKEKEARMTTCWDFDTDLV